MFPGFESYVGPAAGVATAMLWTATSLFFTAAGRRIGPTLVNTFRLVLAVALHAGTHKLFAGTWWPTAVSGQIYYLALSGIVGLSIGDQALFTAFMDIGPRLSLLIMTTSPLFAALFGWLALGETLQPLAGIGVVLTVGGVGWVVLERPLTAVGRNPPHRSRGIILAFVGSVCQAGGLLLSKQGIGHGWLPEDQHLSPQAATFVRMFFAGLGMIPILIVHTARARKLRESGIVPKRVGSRGMGLVFSGCGAVVGPYLGVWMSLMAAHHAPLGVAQTLCSLTPIFILPVLAIAYKEHISVRATLGAVLAVFGSAMLFL
jgi:drug/metabolite transporter (DMT)-like permease